MNTLQKDIDAQNWAIVGPELLRLAKQYLSTFDVSDDKYLSYADIVKRNEIREVVEKAEALNV